MVRINLPEEVNILLWWSAIPIDANLYRLRSLGSIVRHEKVVPGTCQRLSNSETLGPDSADATMLSSRWTTVHGRGPQIKIPCGRYLSGVWLTTL